MMKVVTETEDGRKIVQEVEEDPGTITIPKISGDELTEWCRNNKEELIQWCKTNNIYFVDTKIEADHMESPCAEDQTIKTDADKLKLSLVPNEVIRAIARARMYGLKKYGDKESWKSVSKERYIDALYRHFLAYLDDIGGVDEESGLLHTDHIAFNIAAICELEKGERDGQ